jgi:hypothetical protein
MEDKVHLRMMNQMSLPLEKHAGVIYAERAGRRYGLEMCWRRASAVRTAEFGEFDLREGEMCY